MTIVIVIVVSGALLIGALWCIYGKLGKNTEGFLVAMAGGALLVSAILELIEPSLKQSGLWAGFGFVFLGALVFISLDYLVKKKWNPNSGGGCW